MITGLFTVLVTPFDNDNRVDEEQLRNLIRFQIAAGVAGIVVLGTTGEAPTIMAEEAELIIRIAREETANKTHLMVGTGGNCTADVIIDTRKAQELGADSVLIVSPYYNRPTQEGLYLHFKAVAESTDLPIIVYNIPTRTGQNITPETMTRIALLPHIAGVKETSGNVLQIMEFIEQIKRKKPHFSLLSGDDWCALPTIACGGDGLLSVLSNLVPIQMNLFIQSLLQGKYEEGREWHYKLFPLIKASMCETNPTPIKAMMQLAGIPVGHCRLPLCSLTPENLQRVQETLEDPHFAPLIRKNLSLYTTAIKVLLHNPAF